MGIFRYIVEGFGWEIGRSAAREGIEALENHVAAPDPKLERQSARAARHAQKDRERAEAENQKRIEAQLRELKRRR
jgi:hypothetical protein